MPTWERISESMWAVSRGETVVAAVRCGAGGYDGQVRGARTVHHADTLAEVQHLVEQAMGESAGRNKRYPPREPEPACTLPRQQLMSYDYYVVFFSGGKDSVACVLHLLEQGVPKDKIELWHHDVDGREGSALWDWPVTRDYCQQVADALGLPLYFSWKVGGFEGEMNRRDRPSPPTRFEVPSGEVQQAGGKAKDATTRWEFPKISLDLQQRWCSAALKVDVARIAINNQERFKHARTLVLGGERMEENDAYRKYLHALDAHRYEGAAPPAPPKQLTGRAAYNVLEAHATDKRDSSQLRRHVDQWRPVHAWRDEHVWAIMHRHGIVPHPAYQLGWGRLSCMCCIFGNPRQFASVRALDPERFETLESYECKFGRTLHAKPHTVHGVKTYEKTTLTEYVGDAQPYASITPEWAEQAMGERLTVSVKVASEDWTLPAGAFGDNAGPGSKDDDA